MSNEIKPTPQPLVLTTANRDVIVKYLLTRPQGEVEQLVAYLRGLQPVPPETPPAPTPSKDNK